MPQEFGWIKKDDIKLWYKYLMVENPTTVNIC